MFSSGQLIFAAFFVIAFIMVMVYSYRKDKRLHSKYYKGSIYVLIGFIIFILLLFFIKTRLNH